MKIFKDRIAFVTGGASGIGLGMVRNFLKLGMKTVIVDFNPAYLEELKATDAGNSAIHLVQADVGDRDQVRAAAQEALRTFGKIHVLCNLDCAA
jgi:NAD(P)-dependent dehydrogenase (short-subunit alcohol dehydrogenase family)